MGRKDPDKNWAQLEQPKPKLLKSICSGYPFHIINGTPIKGQEHNFETYVTNEHKKT